MKHQANTILKRARTLSDYRALLKERDFEEFPLILDPRDLTLKDLVDLESADLDLRLHMTRTILKRSFSPTGGIYWPMDVDWYLASFIEDYRREDCLLQMPKPLEKAMAWIMADNFDDTLIATTYLFGVVEFHVKRNLGYRPEMLDYFDPGHKKFRKMGLYSALSELQKGGTAIAHSLNDIDAHNERRLAEVGIPVERWTKAKVSDRLTWYRNLMVHGEAHSFYAEGQYALMIYALFCLHALEEGNVGPVADQSNDS